MHDNYEIPVYKLHLVHDSVQLAPKRPMLDPETAVDVIRRYIGPADREHLVVLMLNSQLVITGINTVSIGTIDATLASPRDIFKPAILNNATGIIVAHNHPSGDPEPSLADKKLFKLIYEAGDILQIKLLDAIIIGEGNRFFSARRQTYDFA